MLLAGVPTLQLPIYLEQAVLARIVERFGAGLYANPENPPEIPDRLDAFLGDDRFAVAAGRFAQQHADYEPESKLDAIADRLEQLIAGGP